jgi:hypothetical protein
MSGYFCGDAHRRLQSIAHKFIFLLFLSLLPAALFAQMVNPAIDAPNQPFSYYSEPTDVIGVMDAPTATLVSPEGFLYTGYGELMFFTGNPQVAIAQRVKTLLRGYLPVIQYSFVREGIRYSFTDFAATLDGRPSGTLVDFIRVQIQNENAESRTAWISSGMRYEGNIDNTEGHADNRYQRPYVASHLGGYSQMGRWVRCSIVIGNTARDATQSSAIERSSITFHPSHTRSVTR